MGERYIDNANTLTVPSYAILDLGVRRSISQKIALDFRITNEAIWDRGRKYLEEQAGVHEPVPL